MDIAAFYSIHACLRLILLLHRQTTATCIRRSNIMLSPDFRLIWICVCMLLLSVYATTVSGESRHGLNKMQQCPCNAAEMCSISKKGVVLCNCWTDCNADCPAGFDRLNEYDSKSCGYGNTRSLCTTNIVCDKALHQHGGPGLLDNKKSQKQSSKDDSNDQSEFIHGEV